MINSTVSECRVVQLVLLAAVLQAGVVPESLHAAGLATAQEAAQVINLETLPLAPNAQPPANRSVVQLSYQAPGDVLSVYKFHQQQLLDSKWKDVPGGGYVSEQSASGTFARDGFLLSVTVSPVGGQVLVSVINHGNVSLGKLPVPPGTTVTYAGPVSSMFMTDAPVERTVSELSGLLASQGWVPYGVAGPQHFFKQNAVRLGVMVAPAPAQGGKTSIMFTSEMMSADLPAPPSFEDLRYTESTRTLDFLTAQSEKELQEFYRAKLADQGWKATTENPLKVGFRDTTIFRNPGMDMLTLETQKIDGKLRAILKQQSAAQVAELEQRAKAAIEKKKQQMEKGPPQVAIAIPTGAEKGTTTPSRIELKTKSGNGKAIADQIRKSLEADGWKGKVIVEVKETGNFEFEKEGQKISLLYIDPGFIPAEITLTGIGVQLEPAGAKTK